MNKAMRDLLAQIEQKTATAREKQAAGDTAAVDGLLAEIDDLQKAYDREEKLFQVEQKQQIGQPQEEGEQPTQREADTKAFAGYIRAVVNKAATPQNITVGNAGAVIPTTIAKEILTEVKQMCSIANEAMLSTEKGKTAIPVYGDAVDDEGNNHNITVSWAEDFEELVADAGKFSFIELDGFLAGALTLIGRSAINRTDVDLVEFVKKEMAKRIAQWLEGKLLNGDEGKNVGALSTKNTVNAESATAITTDELIEVQDSIPEAYQGAAKWRMHPKTLTKLRKLKYETGEHILQKDFTGERRYVLLGKPVETSDNMPQLGAGEKPILYGDGSGLSYKIAENIEMQLLLEKYATKHAIGVVAWLEIDSNVTDHQKLATLTMKAG